METRTAFIDLFIHDLLENGRDLSDSCVVFPSRRAGLIFKKKFANHITKPAWLPSVCSIDDFILSLCPLQVPDAIHLQLELYTVYQKHYPGISFDKFLSWGEILLKDFNEVDLQMIPADRLFSEVFSIRELDVRIGIGEEETERIREFWKLFSGKDLTGIQKEFLENWRSLPVIYNEFRKQLEQNGLAYNGMAARRVAEGLTDGSLVLPWKMVWFAGFYALSRAEKAIFNHLRTIGKGAFRWDADRYYSEDSHQEAGRYFRKKQIEPAEEDFKWTFNYFKETSKNIHITGVPLLTGQARTAGLLLEKIWTGDESPDHTAVVLPDEKLLMPLLYALPENTGPVNITMGYPLQGGATDQLIRSIKNLFAFSIQNNDRNFFRTQDLLALFENSYIRSLNPLLVRQISEQLVKENRLVMDAKSSLELYFHEIMTFLLKESGLKQNPVNGLTTLFEMILEHFKKEKAILPRFDFSLLKFFHRELKKLSRLTEAYSKVTDLTGPVGWRLVGDLLKSLRVPFSGEPVKGLQIMGFLETRNLDFQNLIILSMNEEMMPASASGSSYIPYAIRKAYGLPTFEEHDAIYAYHFYRLLQRAENIYLIYNTEAGALSGGEMSRYLLQIAYEMRKKSDGRIRISHSRMGTDLQIYPDSPIRISKQGAVGKALHRMFFEGENERTHLSATAFSSYILCPLQFYFRYVAGIREPDEIQEEIDPAVFGDIVHTVMEEFYKDHPVVTSALLDSMVPRVEREVDHVIRKKFPSLPGTLTGKNRLLHTVITVLIKKIMEQDHQDAPFTVHGLEKEYVGELKINGGTLYVKGKIDRVDEAGGLTRIIDYKTGQDVVMKKFVIGEVFLKPENKASFQLLLYCWLLLQHQPGSSPRAGLFRLRSVNQGIDFIKDGALINAEDIGEFGEGLKELAGRIVDPETDFIQTEDKKRCRYCAYKDICNR